jgi:translation initiation factor eIF-2B subunit gamma
LHISQQNTTPSQKKRMVQFQAVLLAGGEGLHLYPLNKGLPKALLPIANKPLIYYALKYLKNAGFVEVIVLVTKSIEQRVGEYLLQEFKDDVIHMEAVDDDTETADALRSIHKRIKTDFVVMSVDLITDVPLLNLINIHRLHNSTVTMLLKESSVSNVESSKQLRSVDYIGIWNYDPSNATSSEQITQKPNRVAYFSSSAYVEKRINLRRSYLERWGNITFTQNLKDGFLYVFSKCVIDVLVAKENIISVKDDLIPYLVLNQKFKARKDPQNIIAGIPLSKIESPQKVAYQMSHFPYNPHDLIRCFAYIVPQDKKETSGIFAKRCFCLDSYLEINRSIAEGEIPVYKHVIANRQKSEPNVIIGNDCAIGESVEYEKNTDTKTTLKRCNIGDHCKIGKNVKLIDSVIMDHVIIGANCQIKNSIICSNAIIRPSVNLTNCKVGFSCEVTKAGNYKDETLVSEGTLEIEMSSL